MKHATSSLRSGELMLLLSKAFSLTGIAAAAWFEAVTGRNGNPRQVRTDLRNTYFRSRAKSVEELQLARAQTEREPRTNIIIATEER